MNIEIANRLVNLRKSNNLSQEALAEKLGISRQAISKWERAEASPDTDNLILLAKLYGVSLDELLKMEEELATPESDMPENDIVKDTYVNESSYEDPEYVHIGFEGVHVKDKDGSEVHVGWEGIHVDDKKTKDSVHVDKHGVYINGEKQDGKWPGMYFHFPVASIITIVYLILGVFFGAWHPGWMLFLLIPIWYSLVEAVKKRNAHCFAYPVFVTLLYLCVGFFFGMWHPGWMVFLTIPVYYSIVAYIRNVCKDNEQEYGTAGNYGYSDTNDISGR